MQPLYPDIASFKKAFDPVLLRVLEQHIGRTRALTQNPYIHALLEHTRNLAAAGGKRIRPYVAYLMYASCGGRDEHVLTSLAALELFHLFALIHDDVIDRGALRHGVETQHIFAQSLIDAGHPQRERIAEAQALLVGDVVFGWSMETLTQSLPVERMPETIAEFHAMVRAVVVGQMLDVKTMAERVVGTEDILEKTLLKTAHYTFIHPLRIGQHIAGATSPDASWTTAFGASLGMAFQIRDDLLDILGREEVTGKKSLNDVREGQHTVLTAHIREHGTAEEQEALDACFGVDASDEDCKRLEEAFRSSGAIQRAEERISTELARAEGMLADAGFPEEATQVWRALLARMHTRNA